MPSNFLPVRYDGQKTGSGHPLQCKDCARPKNKAHGANVERGTNMHQSESFWRWFWSILGSSGSIQSHLVWAAVHIMRSMCLQGSAFKGTPQGKEKSGGHWMVGGKRRYLGGNRWWLGGQPTAVERSFRALLSAKKKNENHKGAPWPLHKSPTLIAQSMSGDQIFSLRDPPLQPHFSAKCVM